MIPRNSHVLLHRTSSKRSMIGHRMVVEIMSCSTPCCERPCDTHRHSHIRFLHTKRRRRSSRYASQDEDVRSDIKAVSQITTPVWNESDFDFMSLAQVWTRASSSASNHPHMLGIWEKGRRETSIVLENSFTAGDHDDHCQPSTKASQPHDKTTGDENEGLTTLPEKIAEHDSHESNVAQSFGSFEWGQPSQGQGIKDRISDEAPSLDSSLEDDHISLENTSSNDETQQSAVALDDGTRRRHDRPWWMSSASS